MSIIRVQKTEKFTVISNVHINDDRLSWKATSILTYLLSKPNDWTVYVNQLAKAKKDGIKAVYSGIKELKAFGYIEHKFIHGEDGKIQHGEYIVHEEPIAVETPVNREPLPYTQKGDAVKGNADNGTLLKTNNKLKTDDDKTGPSPKVSPKVGPPPKQETGKDPSSSFSEFELISILAGLINLIPKQHQKPTVSETINKALIIHTEDYIRLAILYTITHSNGNTTQKFKAYLGKCIDLGWADGWEPDQGGQVDKEAIRKRFQKMPDNNLKAFAETGNVWAIEELERR